MASPLEFHKFPEIFYDQLPVVWDSRQAAHAAGEWVVVPGDDVDAKIAETLRERLGAHEVENENPRRWLGEVASQSLGYPSHKLRVIGVTGTNGKTTSVAMIRHLLVCEGHSVLELGTLGARLWSAGRGTAPAFAIETGFTTPDGPQLHDLMAQALKWGANFVVMEVSSHAVALERVAGVAFDACVFTNLTQDHLDFHGTMQAYEAAKAKLFLDILQRSQKSELWAVLNLRDAAGERIHSALLGSRVQSLNFCLGRNEMISTSDLSGFEISLSDGSRVRAPLLGAFNAENLLGALYCVSGVLKKKVVDLSRHLGTFQGARGRLEKVNSSRRHVYVDYAHTPDALEKTLTTVRAVLEPEQKLWVVFGCGGDRDRLKRPKMAAAASRIAHFVVLTSDNPRTEDPVQILEDIASGLETTAHVKKILDRRAAIHHALTSMSSRDVCVIAGKGHETYQIVGSEKLPFDDAEIAREILDQIA